MILPDDTPPSPTKSQLASEETRRDSDQGLIQTTEQSNPPPAYPGPASHQPNRLIYTPENPTTRYPALLAPEPSPTLTYAEPAKRRFIKAFLVAILIWTLLGIFTRGVVEIGVHNKQKKVSSKFIELPL